MRCGHQDSEVWPRRRILRGAAHEKTASATRILRPDSCNLALRCSRCRIAWGKLTFWNKKKADFLIFFDLLWGDPAGWRVFYGGSPKKLDAQQNVRVRTPLGAEAKGSVLAGLRKIQGLLARACGSVRFGCHGGLSWELGPPVLKAFSGGAERSGPHLRAFGLGKRENYGERRD